MKKNGIDIDDVDLYITTQMGKYKIHQLADTLKIPHEKIVVQCDRFGNTPSGVHADSSHKSPGKR